MEVEEAAPKIDKLLEFATHQGVTQEEVIELLEEKKSKKKKGYVAEVPIDEAVAFYFNQEHSTRSWTELRLFLGKYGVWLLLEMILIVKRNICFLKVYEQTKSRATLTLNVLLLTLSRVNIRFRIFCFVKDRFIEFKPV